LREREKDWDSILKVAKRKVLLCADKWDRDDWLNALARALARDESYDYKRRSAHFELLVDDLALGVQFLVITVNVNQWSWPNKTRGLIYDEILVTGRAEKAMESREDLPSALGAARRTGNVGDNALFYLTQNDAQIREGLGGDLSEIVGRKDGSMSEYFDFPTSLFRRGMLQYFEVPEFPTREEFLMALMMENVNGSTAREKAAIEAAQLHVQGKGDNADQGASEQGPMGIWLKEYCIVP
jgi:hypothetical protein